MDRQAINHQRIALDIGEAFEIVLSLARQNIIGEHDDPTAHAAQTAACEMIEDLAVNEYGDD
jgi:hypothetical protein